MASTAATGRRRDIDWLRIAAVLLLIRFHTARVFSWEEDFYIKNVPNDVPAQSFVDFVQPWHMSLLVYEVAVRRWGPVCFLFGMKPRKRPAAGQAHAAAGQGSPPPPAGA
jgi:hypothetical protein